MATIITDGELKTIMKLIEDWGFEYGLRCTSEEVANLKESLWSAAYPEPADD